MVKSSKVIASAYDKLCLVRKRERVFLFFFQKKISYSIKTKTEMTMSSDYQLFSILKLSLHTIVELLNNGSCFQRTHWNHKCYMIMNQVNLVCTFVFWFLKRMTSDPPTEYRIKEMNPRLPSMEHKSIWCLKLPMWLNFWKVFSFHDCNLNRLETNTDIYFFFNQVNISLSC